MRTFAEKPKATQQAKFPKTMVPDRSHLGHNHEANSILHLQRTSANQSVQRLLQGNTEERSTRMTGITSSHSGREFSRIPIHPPITGVIQTKLAINTPGDESEQEANRVADQVMAMPGPQRKQERTFGGEYPGGQMERTSMAYERLRVKGTELNRREGTPVPHIVNQVLASPGQPLDPTIRAFMEPHFGHDFSRVRVHTGKIAEQSAQDINANAYTIGNEMVFGPGRFAPGTREGQRLIAHELVHVMQPNATSVLRRDLVKDAAGNYVSYEFRVGHELTQTFVSTAKKLTADGKLDKTDIKKLKEQATKARDTVNDHERMFMGALLDRRNVKILQRTKIGAKAAVIFALNTITGARLKQVIEVGQPVLPASVTSPAKKAVTAFKGLDLFQAVKQVGKIESAAEKKVRTLVGAALTRQISTIIAFAQANNVSLSNTLFAVLNAASDNTPGDRLMAAAAYTVAAADKHPLAADIRAGKIRMDALSPSNFVKLPGVKKNNRAIYVAAAPINPKLSGLKGDTIYMPTDFDINNLSDRSTVIHELQHAQQDKAASPTKQPTFPAQQGLEEQAYRVQAKYILDQMQGQAAKAQVRSAKQVATNSGDLVLLAVLIEAKSDLKKYRPLVVQVFAAAAPPVHRNATGVAKLLAVPTAKLIGTLKAEILKSYGITATSKTITEGQAGESLIHWIHRL